VDTDENGDVVQLLDYYPFGGIRLNERSGSYENDYKFTGKELDDQTGLYYFGARYYKAGIGRWTNIDPIYLTMGALDEDKNSDLLSNPQKQNSYSYVINNPIIYIDPLGLETVIYVEKGNSKDGGSATVGHAFIEISRDDKRTVYSWGPNFGQRFDQATSGEDLVIASAEDYFKSEGKNHDTYTAYTFETTEEQEGKIKEFYRSLSEKNLETNENKKETYKLLNNCTDIVLGAMKAGGVAEKNFLASRFGVSTPGMLKSQLDLKFNTQNKWYYSSSNFFNFNRVININQRKVIKTGE
jgi:RHS repeat-associated protein